MKSKFLLGSAVAVSAAFLGAAAPAFAAGCDTAGAAPLTIGTVQTLGSDSPGKYSVDLKSGEGVLIELASTADAAASDGEEGEGSSGSTPAAGALQICDAKGALISPLPSEVFANGGSLTRNGADLALRFVAPAAGKYLISAAPADGEREILLRRREIAPVERKVTELELGGSDFVKVSSAKPLVYSFTAKAGQWVKITATSDNDTVLHLAAPNPDGSYEVIADNDDSDGLNPMIRRRLPANGTYYVQLESLSSDENDATVLIQATEPPPPPPPPTALKVGAEVSGTLANSDEKKVYALPVIAGHSYRLELTAPYDAVIEVGLDDPFMPEDSDEGNGFSSVKSEDSNLSGTEKLNFTARSTGRILVQVRAYNLEEGNGDYKLKAVDNGM